MTPPAEHVHWLFASCFVFLGLCLLAEAIVGPEVWRRRPWRPYLWPSLAFTIGVAMWPVMVFFTNSTIHMLAHSAWAQFAMLAGAAELGRVRGKLRSRYWSLTVPLALVVSGGAFLVHEQNGWLFQRSSFLHHVLGWTVLLAAAFPLGRVFRPRSVLFAGGFACTWLTVAVLLYCDRDLAPVFGHLSQSAGVPHR